MADEFVRNTTVLVCRGVPLDNKYNDTILFTSAGAQQGYFAGVAKYTYNGQFTYQRVQNKVNNYTTLQTLPNPRVEFSCRIPVSADFVYDCNYLCFKNNYGTNKWWYCFIKEINYINPNCCEIIYEIDAIQTFLFDFHVEKSFVEREHTATDNYRQYVCLEDEICIGEEILIAQENLISDYINNYTAYLALFADSDTSKEKIQDNNGTIFTAEDLGAGKKAQGVIFGEFPEMENLTKCLGDLSEEGKGNECIAIITLPSYTASGQWVVRSTFDTEPTWSVQGETIHNKMCYQYPFRKMVLQSSSGESYEFHPRNFYAKYPGFLLNRLFTGDDIIYSIKPNYCIGENKSKQLFLTTAQMGAWTNSAYQTWLAQNKGSLIAQLIGGSVNTIAGLAMAGVNISTANPIGTITGLQNAAQGVRDLSQAVGRISDAKHLPDNVHGKYGNASFDFEVDELGFWFYDYRLDDTSLRRIDSYFTRYGYKINTIKVPTPFDGNKRPIFNFVKTVDVNLTGSVPTPQMNIIKSAFDRGITFWHNTNVGVYTEGANDV